MGIAAVRYNKRQARWRLLKYNLPQLIRRPLWLIIPRAKLRCSLGRVIRLDPASLSLSFDPCGHFGFPRGLWTSQNLQPKDDVSSSGALLQESSGSQERDQRGGNEGLSYLGILGCEAGEVVIDGQEALSGRMHACMHDCNYGCGPWVK